MDNTQLGWLITLILGLLVALYCYAYFDRILKRLILPPRYSSSVQHRTPHVHVQT